MSKKPYSEYDCPVCQKKDIQQGSFGKHLAKHTVAELLKFVKNIDAVKTDGAHPEIHVNGSVFAVCHDTQYGYQKGLVKPLTNEKKHGQECKLLYHNWATAQDVNPPQNLITVEIPVATQPVVTQPVVTQPVVTQPVEVKQAVEVEQPVAPVQNAVALVQNAVALLLECSNKTKCDCHLEITHLKEKILEQNRELELFRQWRQMVISLAPPEYQAPEPEQTDQAQPHPSPEPNRAQTHRAQTQEPQQTADVPEVQAVAPPPVPKKRVQITEPKQVKTKPTIKASKKEKEKGMWCETCESCKQTAQFATDLRPCGRCGKKCHYNDDLVGCYHFDCEICDTKICLPCVKAAGAQSNKMHPMCSPECYKKYMAAR